VRNVLRPALLSAALVFAAPAGYAQQQGDPQIAPQHQGRQWCKENPEECRAQMQRNREAWWKKNDADGDGAVSREEAEKNAPRLAKNFDRIDANSDGKVTPEELQAARKAAHERHKQHHDRSVQ
jgi:hypothetical protein